MAMDETALAAKGRKLPGAFFALVVGLGYLAALTNLFLTHHDADLKPGLGPGDIVARYHGDPAVTRLSYMATGSMRKHFKGNADEYRALMDWVAAGGKEDAYEPVGEIIEARCEKCHSDIGKASFAPMTSYEEVAVFLAPNEGITWQRLAMLSHQHFFGMGLLCLSLSLILWNQTGYPARLKIALTCLGFMGMIGDIGGWWLTKLAAPFAFVTLGGGAMTGMFFGLGIVLVWYDLVFRKT
ncbi:MAG: hypothetical protein IT350_15150 [Deltaproteobacteria bacterium]|nr:hypothetical protein [Deltaproteobacteria bacterium]